MAPAELQEIYAASLHSVPSAPAPASSYPSIDTMKERKGKCEGEVKVFNNQGKSEAYSWSEANQKWDLIGSVVDGPEGNSSSKEMLNGKQYDNVFDVELPDGGKYKIGINNGDNPYTVAQSFITSHDLDQSFLDEIAEFVTKNTQAFQIGQQEELPSDPLTGGGRYIPQHHQTSSSRPDVQMTSEFIPATEVKTFTTLNAEGMLNKFMEFNQRNEFSKMTEEEISVLHSLISIVKQESHPTSFTVIQMTLLTKLLSWPPAFLLPVFDILTHLVLRSSSSLSLSQWRGGAIFSTLFNISNSSPEIQSLSLLTLRFIANSTSSPNFTSIIKSNLTELLQFCCKHCSSSSQTHQLTAATALLNIMITTRSPIAAIQSTLELCSVLIILKLISLFRNNKKLFKGFANN
eukprot:TRINITY_DN11858_c0_g1_i2.p1 TRINITY_DN11858_c0_g1~~TRINITY_DN11858_c0_g1_i2.p1  ORF type:complete len:404 (-),score=129.76 TRINITY_DN11858_c0_g1_i2:267-1478(-)